jgi:hypothetical protein
MLREEREGPATKPAGPFLSRRGVSQRSSHRASLFLTSQGRSTPVVSSPALSVSDLAALRPVPTAAIV